MRAVPERPSSHSSKVLVSACLAGEPCRYDGASKADAEVSCLAAAGRALPACPECLGGLSVPREPSEIVGGDGRDVLDGRARVVSRSGRDVTDAYLAGAEAFLRRAQKAGVQEAILKAKSPSCGVSEIYDGTHCGRLRPGPGVTAALLERSGIRIREK